MNIFEIIKSDYKVNLPKFPVCEGPMGILYDFNDGARLYLPSGNWHILIEDKDTGNILEELDSTGGMIQSYIRYYVKFSIKVWIKGHSEPIFEHTLNLKGKKIRILFSVYPTGDVIAWMSTAVAFVKKHSCQAEFTMSKQMSELFKDQYPEIAFIDPRSDILHFKSIYASYHLGNHYSKDEDYDSRYSPYDLRISPLHSQATALLGINVPLTPPKVKYGSRRIIPERYVVIACKTTKKAKKWNNPNGWIQTAAYLRRLGYRVICIGIGIVQDKEKQIPVGAEDFTGKKPLTECAAIIEHCDFFIGLDTGLSWLAWCMARPVVVIGGFTLPHHLFYTPYHVITQYACGGCFHDVHFSLFEELYPYDCCPRHKGTSREFECSKLITGKQVIRTIQQLMIDNNLTRPCDGKSIYSY